MTPLLRLLSLLVALSSAWGEDPPTAQGDGSPITNMQLDPRRKLLTWNYRSNVTSHKCQIQTPPNFFSSRDLPVTGGHAYSCQFSSSVLHRGATFTVTATMAHGVVFQESLVFHNPGKEASAAVNFSCVIYRVRFMNCSWEPGPAAPADVRYDLYMWTSLQEDEAECPHYLAGPTGTRVGCHFAELGAPQRTDHYFFLVTGTSQEAAIPFLDFTPFKGVQMEKYDPPANVSVGSNGTHYLFRWDNPETRFNNSHAILYYELDIQAEKGGSSKRDPVFQRGGDENVYLVPRAALRGEHTFRARVRFAYGDTWSDWSARWHFGLPERDAWGTPVALVGLVVGAVVFFTKVLTFLCTRSSLSRKLFPPVPQVRRGVTGPLGSCPEVAWDEDRAPPCAQDPEDVLAVEDTRPPASAQPGTGVPAQRPLLC